jgi:16S rRNA (uracil1498-N3)-methyltransferase
MSRRYFVDSPITGETAVLTGQEAQHLSKVMRAKVGDELVLFDGSGAEFPARIEKIARSQVDLSVSGRREVDRELPFRLVIGVALPKGDRQRWLVEKLVELGVGELVPLVTARSVAQPSGNALERLQRAVAEASKQCGRNRLMVVSQANTFADFIVAAAEIGTRLIAHPPADGELVALSIKVASGSKAIVAVGPEGGFTDDEIALADEHHWSRVSLGSRVLRTETAAVALAAALSVPRGFNA